MGDKDCFIIEKYLTDNERMVLHYSEYVNEATIKIFRKSKPNLKFKSHSTYKAVITYDLLKELAEKYIFVKNPDLKEIINFVEEKLKLIEV